MLDVQRGEFLATETRHKLFQGSPLVSVPVLWSGEAKSLTHLQSLVRTSLYKSDEWRERLRETCHENKQKYELVQQQTDDSDLAEGLYIKVEENGRVVERYKFVRASFLQAVEESGGHWMDRPILPNRLRAGSDLFSLGQQ